MSLLSQFGVTPIAKTRKKTTVNDVQISYTGKKSKICLVSIQRLIETECLDWDAFDFGYSKEHGFMIAKGTTYKLRKDGRCASLDIFRAVVHHLKLKHDGGDLHVNFDAIPFSENVYKLKLIADA